MFYPSIQSTKVCFVCLQTLNQLSQLLSTTTATFLYRHLTGVCCHVYLYSQRPRQMPLQQFTGKINRYFKILQRGPHSWCDGYLAATDICQIFLKDLVEETQKRSDYFFYKNFQKLNIACTDFNQTYKPVQAIHRPVHRKLCSEF